MKKVSKMTLSILLVLGLSSSLFANGLSLNSVGPRALGMGGAFVAQSDDATAIYWNPAGLAGQKSALNLFFTGIMPSGSYKMEAAGIDAKLASNIYPTGGLLGVYSAENLTFGLGVYVPAGLGAEWDLADFSVPSSLNIELLSQIGVINISPAIAYQVSDAFSIGLAVNISYAMFDMKQQVDGGALGLFQFEENSTGLGYGATLGLKVKMSEQVVAGATVRLASKVAMSGTAKNPMFSALPTIPPGVHPDYPNGLMPGPGESDFDRDVTWPLWIAGGISWKPAKCLTLEVDAQYSQWSELDKLVATYDEAYWETIMAAEGENEFNLKWKDAVQVRLGGEYMLSPKTAIRLGYYYDPAPAPDETLVILFPSSTNHVVTAGFGHCFGGYRIDAGVEYLIGADRDVKAIPGNAQPGIHHLDVFAFSVGFGVGL